MPGFLASALVLVDLIFRTGLNRIEIWALVVAACLATVLPGLAGATFSTAEAA